MFHPIGEQPPSVYWRRRLVLVGGVIVLVVLLALTVNAVAGGGSAGSSPAAGAAPRTSATVSPTPASSAPASSSSTPAHPSSTSAAARASSSATSGSPAGSSAGSASATGTAAAATCTAAQLAVQAVVGKSSYSLGQQPLLELQVTDKSTDPCVQNLADSQIELRVYNGESRVWGSHDCKIEPGTMLRTLTPGTPVRVAIQWSGYSSQPDCAGTRQKVGAGTYTLYALLSGHSGAAAQFSMV